VSVLPQTHRRQLLSVAIVHWPLSFTDWPLHQFHGQWMSGLELCSIEQALEQSLLFLIFHTVPFKSKECKTSIIMVIAVPKALLETLRRREWLRNDYHHEGYMVTWPEKSPTLSRVAKILWKGCTFTVGYYDFLLVPLFAYFHSSSGSHTIFIISPNILTCYCKRTPLN